MQGLWEQALGASAFSPSPTPFAPARQQRLRAGMERWPGMQGHSSWGSEGEASPFKAGVEGLTW